jgi:hypothetical protein
MQQSVEHKWSISRDLPWHIFNVVSFPSGIAAVPMALLFLIINIYYFFVIRFLYYLLSSDDWLEWEELYSILSRN